MPKKIAITTPVEKQQKPSKKAAGKPMPGTVPVGKKKASADNIVLKKERKPKSDTLPQKAAGKKKQPESQKASNNKNSKVKRLSRIIFQLHFHTIYGQELFIVGNHPLLGDNEISLAAPMRYFNEEYWHLEIDMTDTDLPVNGITYHYVLKNADGSFTEDWGNDKTIDAGISGQEELLCVDSWNYAGYFENSFYTEPFEKVLLKKDADVKVTGNKKKQFTHLLKVKAPLLGKDQTLCVLGSVAMLGNWDIEQCVLMNKPAGSDFYTCELNLAKTSFPIAYKYGVYDTAKKTFIRFEDGNNRVLHDSGMDMNRLTVMNDGFAILPNNTWKGAGIAIPVFSLRTEQSFGVGEFADMKLMVDWAKQVGLKMIQILPVNDTTATHSWTDSYPYAAISAFALHPLYLNLAGITDEANKKKLQQLEKERIRLNALEVVDYTAVTKTKMEFAATVFTTSGKQVLASAGYQLFFEQNKHWLVPYAVFCYLRDQYGTVNFNQWPAFREYHAEEIAALADSSSKAFDDISFYYFIQYQLHLQLTEAAAYAHANGIILKGDIAIGVYRYGADAWQAPHLYHLQYQAGAPPDGFAVKGQNWGFPTYNWQHMLEDGYAWWKQRFAQMSNYFDAFRIDHILGFFRIWSIPMHAVEGIMGHFVPSIPVHITEFHSNGVWFDYERYTRPFINEKVLWEVFGYDNELVKSMFLLHTGGGNYNLKPEYCTQRLVEQHFETLDKDTHHDKIKQGLYDLISNVILFEEGRGGTHFHFRFGMEETASFRQLDGNTQQQLKALYVDYFFRRQDDFWMKEALQKLPALKRVTNMLVCGEDLGLVPACVPEVMRQLGLLSLEIQRMPKDPKKEFFHPNDAPYLSVVTPSTHDMSTIRGWWEEDREATQHFYNKELGQWGEAPAYCEAWINKSILLQHLYSPAMWSVFQLQDLLGIDEQLRRKNPADERINIPADPKHYWRYRMHISIEKLINAKEYNQELKGYIADAGR